MFGVQKKRKKQIPAFVQSRMRGYLWFSKYNEPNHLSLRFSLLLQRSVSDAADAHHKGILAVFSAVVLIGQMTLSAMDKLFLRTTA